MVIENVQHVNNFYLYEMKHLNRAIFQENFPIEILGAHTGANRFSIDLKNWQMSRLDQSWQWDFTELFSRVFQKDLYFIDIFLCVHIVED